jgi:hypothetical protein
MKKVLFDVVINRKDLRVDLKARVAKAISVDDNGNINVEKVPIDKKENDLARVRGILVKHGKVRLLGQFIHAAKAIAKRTEYSERYPDMQSPNVEAIVTTPEAGNWNGHDATHKKIFQDLDRVCSLCPPVFLSLTEIENHARGFYKIDEGLKKKSERKTKQTEFFKATVAKKQERKAKARKKARTEEITRIAELWGLPEIERAKNVKAAHMIDKDLSRVAGKGFKPKAIIFSPCLRALDVKTNEAGAA